MQPTYPYWLAGRAEQPNTDLEVRDKFTGAVATRVAMADHDALERGIAAAVRAAEPMRRLPSHARQAVLRHATERFRERAEELADILCTEAGKPIKDARGEVGRLIDTFSIAAEEAVRITGEVLPLDIAPRAEGGYRSAPVPSFRRSTSL